MLVFPKRNTSLLYKHQQYQCKKDCETPTSLELTEKCLMILGTGINGFPEVSLKMKAHTNKIGHALLLWKFGSDVLYFLKYIY